MGLRVQGPASHTYFSQRLRLHYVDWGNEQAPPGYVLLDELRHRRLFGLRTTTAYLVGNTTSPSCPPITGR